MCKVKDKDKDKEQKEKIHEEVKGKKK